MIMKFNYGGLWKLLIDKRMKKDLTLKFGNISNYYFQNVERRTGFTDCIRENCD